MIDLAEYTQLAATIAGISEVLLAFAFFYFFQQQRIMRSKGIVQSIGPVIATGTACVGWAVVGLSNAMGIPLTLIYVAVIFSVSATTYTISFATRVHKVRFGIK